MRDGPLAGLALVDDLMRLPALSQYVPGHAARADLCRRVQRYDDARDAYRLALELSGQGPARRYFQQQLDALPPG